MIDNGSTDKSVDGLEQRWPDIKVTRLNQNVGFAAANNLGAHLAHGDWLALLNTDAFPDPDWLEKLLRTAEQEPGFSFFASRQLQANAPHLLDGTGDVLHTSGLAWRRYAGFPASPTLSYLGYAWSGGSVTFDGQAVTGNAGVSSAGTGTHTLSVGGTDFIASISQAPTPAAAFTASGSSPVTLNWSVTAGTFLDVAIDHGVTIPSSPSGSVQVSPPVDTDYWLYVITREGGIVKSVNTGAPILNVPSTITVLAGLNYSVNKGAFTIQNDGGGTLQWTATSQTPSLITMDTPTGQTATQGTIGFTLNVGSLPPGDYVGTIDVDAGTAGAAQVTVNVKLVSILYKVHLTLVAR